MNLFKPSNRCCYSPVLWTRRQGTKPKLRSSILTVLYPRVEPNLTPEPALLASLFENSIYLLAALGLCCCTWAFFSCGEQGLLWLWPRGFSLRWLLLLRSTGSGVCRLQALCRLGFVALGMWHLPGLRTEPVSPALAGGLVSSGPSGKSLNLSSIYQASVLCRVLNRC